MGPEIAAAGMPTSSAYKIVRPTSAWKMMTASIAAGCGGAMQWTTESPASIGRPTRTREVRVRRATVNAIGISRTKATSKKTGKPTISDAHSIDQGTCRSPKSCIKVSAIRSEAPDSAIILPSMVPRPTTIAICPSVLPVPVSKDPTMFSIRIPVATARANETVSRERKGLSLTTAISRISTTTEVAAAISRERPWLSIMGGRDPGWLGSLFPARAGQKASASLPGGIPVLIGQYAVDPNSRDPLGAADRVSESSRIFDGLRIEEHQVGVRAFADASPPLQPEALGGHTGHFVHGLCQRDEALLPAVIAQHAGKRPP